MKLKNISDDHLLAKTHKIAMAERKISAQFLHYLMEVERRKLYVPLGYTNLFLFLTLELKYSESSAQRRIQALRMIRTVPSVVRDLSVGDLSLASLGKIEQYVRAEKKNGNKLSAEQQEALVREMHGLGARDVEERLADRNPRAFPGEKVRPLGNGDQQVVFKLSREQQDLLGRVRQIYSHVDPHATFAELFEMLAKYYLDRKDPLEAKKAKPNPSGDDMSLPRESKGDLASRRIPAGIERRVRRRDRNQCVWILPNGRACGSKWQLEIDHILPVSKGGGNHAENLRCLCGNHHRWVTLQEFGRWDEEDKKIPKSA